MNFDSSTDTNKLSKLLASQNLIENDLEELARAIDLGKLVQIIKAKPEMGEVIDSLVSDLMEGEGPDAESLLTPKNSSKKPRRFSLQSLPPDVASVMSLFDFDGNGKVTLEEVKRGAELLQETKKKHKVALWALAIQFLIYAVLTALSCGLLYHFLYLMKDTAVDTSTGTLMVKDSGDSTGKQVEVSIKSHGTSFSYDAVVVNTATGTKKGCIHGSKASEMFNQITHGASTVFVNQDTVTGDVKAVPLGAGGASWTNTTLDLGGMILMPDADCTAEFLANNEDAKPGERRSLISRENLQSRHVSLRDLVVFPTTHGASNNRRLESNEAHGADINPEDWSNEAHGAETIGYINPEDFPILVTVIDITGHKTGPIPLNHNLVTPEVLNNVDRTDECDILHALVRKSNPCLYLVGWAEDHGYLTTLKANLTFTIPSTHGNICYRPCLPLPDPGPNNTW